MAQFNVTQHIFYRFIVVQNICVTRFRLRIATKEINLQIINILAIFAIQLYHFPFAIASLHG